MWKTRQRLLRYNDGFTLTLSKQGDHVAINKTTVPQFTRRLCRGAVAVWISTGALYTIIRNFIKMRLRCMCRMHLAQQVASFEEIGTENDPANLLSVHLEHGRSTTNQATFATEGQKSQDFPFICNLCHVCGTCLVLRVTRYNLQVEYVNRGEVDCSLAVRSQLNTGRRCAGMRRVVGGAYS